MVSIIYDWLIKYIEYEIWTKSTHKYEKAISIGYTTKRSNKPEK